VETIQLCPDPIRAAINLARRSLEEAVGDVHTDLESSAEAAELIGALTEDPALANAVLARSVLGQAGIDAQKLGLLVGEQSAGVAQDLARLGELGLPRNWSPSQGLDSHQAETLRKMLLAVVRDPRLVLSRLAEQVIRLRHARELSEPERERLAVEARAVFAPLANRLGVWQLKWELEDLAFRYLEAERYREIAAALNERRADRELYIDALCKTLRSALLEAGITAAVYGRPKHMYSIYRKMQRKQLAFEQLFDLRAVRIVVSSIPECYAALGIVHGRWPYIPGEFDDYIATPKGNFYRSIHTAVIGPGSKSVEVQIRTREMHEHAELGFAAHWTYKEGAARDSQYERKIEWVRRLFEPHETVSGTQTGNGADGTADRDFLERIQAELFGDRVYVLTPKGEVIDLPRAATALDFAYHIHTSLGHRCRGAKVNGRIVPLTQPLANGEIIEIITGKQESPSRDWLAPELGFLASPRSRAKVRAWFRKQNSTDNRAAGRTIAERELARIGAKPEHLSSILQSLQARDADTLYLLLGEGEISVAQLIQAAVRFLEPRETETPQRLARRPAQRRASPIEVEGVGNLPITLAHCCKPLRPQSIRGYVTVGRGVTIHRSECASLGRMRAIRPERVLNVEWASDVSGVPVDLEVRAFDRRGLVRDITDVLALERLSIESMSTTTDREAGSASVSLTVCVTDLEQLSRILRKLGNVPNVIHARRIR
jgi:GTP pyrophosphokinase